MEIKFNGGWKDEIWHVLFLVFICALLAIGFHFGNWVVSSLQQDDMICIVENVG